MQDSRELSNMGTPVSVSASELVRNFGEWQDRALNRPVFIHKRGRSRLVLMATDLLDRRDAAVPAAPDMDRDNMGHPVMEGMAQPVLLMDESLVVRWHNRAATDLFGSNGASLIGTPFADLGYLSGADYLVTVLRRVSASRIADSIEMTIGDNGRERLLSLTIQPLRDGVALIARDVALHHALAEAKAALEAVDGALALLPGVATVRVNARGYCASATGSLMQLTGLGDAALRQVRLASLFDVRSRVAVTDAVEAVFSDRAPRLGSGVLLRNGGDPVPVAIAFSPVPHGATIHQVQLVMIRGPGEQGAAV